MKISHVLLFLSSLLLVVLAFFFQQQLAQFRSLGLLGILLINFFGSATLFLPAPGIASVVAGGAVYSPLLVALVAALGSAAGDMVGYGLGHSGKKVLLRREFKGGAKPMTWLFKHYSGVLIFLFALIPNPVFDVIGILAGVFAYPAYRFFLIMLVGRLIRNIALAYAGFAIAVR